MQKFMGPVLVVSLVLLIASPSRGAEVIERKAKDTLTAVEMDSGDTLHFTLKDGHTRTLVLEDTAARALLTNLDKYKHGSHGGGLICEMTCRVRIDGHPMTMRRYLPVQQSFYEPYAINGMRIWFDGVREVNEFITEIHGECFPKKQARFAVQDATLPICPQQMRPWYPNKTNTIDVRDCYNGDDVWMGPYQGADAHGGLDVNLSIGTPLWAPIDFDDQYLFNSLAAGHNNNRWRGIRRWPNGDVWALQTHHDDRLLVPEHAPIKQGTHYAVGAGVHCGSFAHTHFVFKVGRGKDAFSYKKDEGVHDIAEGKDRILLDPWILFWQIFENNKQRAGAIRSSIAPFEPAETGRPVVMQSRSRPGVTSNRLSHYWTFGDGGWSDQPAPRHTYLKPGIYPVTLVVDDGTEQATFTQHITVDGEPVDSPGLALACPDEVTFRARPVDAMDVYGRPVRFIPHTLEFLARPSGRPKPAAKTITLRNVGAGELGDARCEILDSDNAGWLKVTRSGSGNQQQLSVQVDASDLKPKLGKYRAVVSVDCPGAVNSPQSFRVELKTPITPPQSDVTIDNLDDGCYATPWFWLAPRFRAKWAPGFRDIYLTSGNRAVEGQFVRFTPDLAAGKYEVRFSDQTPFQPCKQVGPDIRFAVRVRHKHSTDTIWVEPLESRLIGAFEFDEGTDGYVEVRAGGAKGPVVADAVRFKQINRQAAN